MIAVKNIEKSFDGIPVLKGISTEFDKGKPILLLDKVAQGKPYFSNVY